MPLQDDSYRPIEHLQASLGVVVADLFTMLNARMSDEVVPHAITSMEYSLLWYCLEGERTATQLAWVLPVDGSRISRMVTRLVDKGLLLRRRRRSDRRIVMLRLTDEGSEVASLIYRNMKRHYVMLTEDISAEDLRVFASVCSRVLANHAADRQSE